MTTARQDMLTAQLRSATTRAERRRAVSAFNASEASDPGSEYRDALDAYMRTGRDSELRAMGETDNTAGGFGVYAAFRDELVTQLKAYGSLYRDFQPVTTDHGRPMLVPTRMLASSFNSGAIQPEGTTVDDGDDVVFGQANLAAFTYPTGVLKVSIPVEDDSSVVTIRSAITAYASEVIGRRLSPLSVSGTGLGEPCGVMTVAETVGAWSAGKSGGYIALDAATPVTIDGTATTELIAGIPAPSTLLKMVGAVNAAYRDDNCKWYCSTDQYIALCSITDDDGNPLILPNGPRVLHGFPIAIADELPALQSGNVGGPVFGNLSAGMYMRDAGYSLLRLVDRFADALQVGYLGWGRYDFRARDVRAFVTVKGNSS